MPTFSFDIVSEIDLSEINNVFDQSKREIDNRYDFKNTPASIEWIEDKKGIKVLGNSEFQIDSIIEIIRKKIASRNLSQKILDTTKPITEANLVSTKLIPFVSGLDQEKTKKVSKLIRDSYPKSKPTIQGESVRVVSNSKDELQEIIQLLKSMDLYFPIQFTNYR